MAGWWLRRATALVVVAVVTSGAPLCAKAQDVDELVGLQQQLGRLHSQGNYAEALLLAERYVDLARQKHGEEHAEFASALAWIALVYKSQGRHSEAEPLYRRSLALHEKALGPDHPHVGTLLNNLAELYRAQGRYAEAEPLYRRSLALREKALGSDHPDVGNSLNNLALLYSAQGRYGMAEPLYQRSLALREKALGSDHRAVGAAVNNLGMLYRLQGRYTEAEPLFQRALAIHEKALGPDHPDVGTLVNNLAAVYESLGRYAQAVPLFQRALAIKEKALGPDHPAVVALLNNLAALYRLQGRHGEAEPVYRRALAIGERALGTDHPEVGRSLGHLGQLYQTQGRYSEAEPLFHRALVTLEKALGPDHPSVAYALNNLAVLHFAQHNWERAVDHERHATAILTRRAERGSIGQTPTGKEKREAQANAWFFWGLVKAAHRLGGQDRNREPNLNREMFETAQWAQSSEAAGALAQMAARSAKGDAQLARIVRERQELVAEWQKRDAARAAFAGQASDTRNKQAEAINVTRLTTVDARVAEIDKRLASEFPDYAALVSPKPLSVVDAQSSLQPDEALVLFLDTPEAKPTPQETFIWVVTRTEARWVRSELGTPALTREVAALRCGLDAAAWENAGAESCSGLLNIAPDKVPKGNAPLPFDVARAHALYKTLFGQVGDLVRDKHLLIVPSGALTQLPFQVLVTAPSTSGDYRPAAWLARKHAITVLPAVSSLKVLRRVSRPSAAAMPMIGFGNPLLDGNPAERPWEAEWAKLARQKQACPQTPWQRMVALLGRRSVVPMTIHSGRADLDHLRAQVPLHDTADELCAVAKDLQLASDDIVLGSRATEATVKRLSTSGKLAQYRVLHFATHGTVAGEIESTTEPGLILTPPREQSEEDDGYLSASEVAGLKLDADLVILSACNTAAGGALGAEALSGLARAFIYAGARALLVSHWSVDSAATVKLIAHAVGAITRDAKLGRAEALRRAMLALIDKGEPKEAHPAYWAPFIVVGEGATR